MTLVIGSDHAGWDLKQAVIAHLQAAGHAVTDLGPDRAERCDYPDFAAAVSRAVAAGDAPLGILCCGSGQGMAMAANRIPGVRAAVVSDTFSAHATREHNDANVLCMGQRVIGAGLACDIADAFVGAAFEGGRHAERVAKITALEQES
jgi:ribose 5-phosphate isomerase B